MKFIKTVSLLWTFIHALRAVNPNFKDDLIVEGPFLPTLNLPLDIELKTELNGSLVISQDLHNSCPPDVEGCVEVTCNQDDKPLMQHLGSAKIFGLRKHLKPNDSTSEFCELLANIDSLEFTNTWVNKSWSGNSTAEVPVCQPSVRLNVSSSGTTLSFAVELNKSNATFVSRYVGPQAPYNTNYFKFESINQI